MELYTKAENWMTPELSDGYNENEMYKACSQVATEAIRLNEGYIQYLIDTEKLLAIIPPDGNEWDEYINQLNK